MSLDRAIEVQQQFVDSLGSPKEDTREWWLLRAHSLGLSFLKAVKILNLTTVQADAYRKDIRKQLSSIGDSDGRNSDAGTASGVLDRAGSGGV